MKREKETSCFRGKFRRENLKINQWRDVGKKLKPEQEEYKRKERIWRRKEPIFLDSFPPSSFLTLFGILSFLSTWSLPPFHPSPSSTHTLPLFYCLGPFKYRILESRGRSHDSRQKEGSKERVRTGCCTESTQSDLDLSSSTSQLWKRVEKGEESWKESY